MDIQTPAGRARPLVLIAEDVGVQVRLTQMCVERADCDVIAAADGLDALQLLTSRLPDLVILDIDMPGMNGFQVWERMRKEPATAHIPVLLLTAHAKDSVLFDRWARPSDRFMTKPFSPPMLIDTIRRVMAPPEALPG